jgi:hypothetical protein
LVWKIQTSGGNTIKSTNRASVKELKAVKIFVRVGNNFSKKKKFYKLTVSDGPTGKMAGRQKRTVRFRGRISKDS